MSESWTLHKAMDAFPANVHLLFSWKKKDSQQVKVSFMLRLFRPLMTGCPRGGRHMINLESGRKEEQMPQLSSSSWSLTGGRTAFSRLSCGKGLDEELVVVASQGMRLQLLRRLSSRCSTSGVSGASNKCWTWLRTARAFSPRIGVWSVTRWNRLWECSLSSSLVSTQARSAVQE